MGVEPRLVSRSARKYRILFIGLAHLCAMRGELLARRALRILRTRYDPERGEHR
jgi:hypothetical protein